MTPAVSEDDHIDVLVTLPPPKPRAPPTDRAGTPWALLVSGKKRNVRAFWRGLLTSEATGDAIDYNPNEPDAHIEALQERAASYAVRVEVWSP